MSAPANKDNEPLIPDGITCPEGIWVREALYQLRSKLFGNEANQPDIKGMVKHLTLALLENPEINIFSIDSYDGLKGNLERDYLRGRQPSEDFIRGFIPFKNDIYVSDTDGYFIFLDKKHFQSYLADEPITQNSSSENENYIHSEYIPPYIQFMLRALKELGLCPDERADMDEIKTWLEENWPVELEGKSDRMIQYMATFLRRPEDKKGGNTPWT